MPPKYGATLHDQDATAEKPGPEHQALSSTSQFITPKLVTELKKAVAVTTRRRIHSRSYKLTTRLRLETLPLSEDNKLTSSTIDFRSSYCITCIFSSRLLASGSSSCPGFKFGCNAIPVPSQSLIARLNRVG